jgi:hypothetical protein
MTFSFVASLRRRGRLSFSLTAAAETGESDVQS